MESRVCTTLRLSNMKIEHPCDIAGRSHGLSLRGQSMCCPFRSLDGATIPSATCSSGGDMFGHPGSEAMSFFPIAPFVAMPVVTIKWFLVPFRAMPGATI